MTAVGDYKFSTEFTTTPEMVTKFNENGYIIVRNLFNAEEVQKISSVVENAQEMKKYKFGVKDENGNESAQITWNHPGNDVTGMAARCQKIVTTAEKLLGGEVYHYHSKVVLKDPKTGGGRAWHQDYGYWYQNGCLFPDMLTVFVAIDKADAENGCLEVLPGSHLCGRVEHQLTGSETGADKERVQQLMKVLPRLQVEMESGDAIFFHCNLLHYSAANHSQRRRLAFLVAYNMAANDPVRESHHPRYTPLEKVDDDAVVRCTNTSVLLGKDFLDMPNLKSLQSQTKFK